MKIMGLKVAAVVFSFDDVDVNVWKISHVLSYRILDKDFIALALRYLPVRDVNKGCGRALLHHVNPTKPVKTIRHHRLASNVSVSSSFLLLNVIYEWHFYYQCCVCTGFCLLIVGGGGTQITGPRSLLGGTPVSGPRSPLHRIEGTHRRQLLLRHGW